MNLFSRKREAWIKERTDLCTPHAVRLCNASEDEYASICNEMVDQKKRTKLNSEKRPNRFLARSDPSDVARAEDHTFICSETRAEAGVNHNWIDPAAVNPEAGFFGVAPGTGLKTNPNAMTAMSKNTIFTNVALPEEGDVGWQGTPRVPGKGTKAAHPNSRFTIFGGRRTDTTAIFLAAGMESEKTAAAVGERGVVRQDPMAMMPFFGYHFLTYFKYWLKFEKTLKTPTTILGANWFRKGCGGLLLWNGYSENRRILKWGVDRAQGTAEAAESPIRAG